jgi:indole-3-glycerol phosphate synthase
MTFLADILSRKRAEVDARRSELHDRELSARIAGMPPVRSLRAALSPPGGPVAIIAEVKRASPSAGAIRASLDPAALAAEYVAAGAAAVSVLTDGPGFGGSLDDLRSVRAALPAEAPILRKDFVLDRYQLLEARAAGADAALLIVAALSEDELRRLRDDAAEIGLEVLVEVHDEAELDVALALAPSSSKALPPIGVNNRNLKTFQVDIATSTRLLPRVHQASAIGVAESGIKGPDEVRRLRSVGASNFLVGEALVRADSAAALLRAMREAS